VEAINRGIRDHFGADACQNVDRVMRLPGTINFPNAKKRAAGRGPAMAGILERDSGRVYGLEELAAAFPEKPKEKAGKKASSSKKQRTAGGPNRLLAADDLPNCPPRLRAMIEEPGTAFAHYDRSRWAVAI